MSDIEVKCPGCQRRLRLNEQLRGKAVRCPDCKTAFSLKPADAPQQPEGTTQSKTSRSKTPTQTSDADAPRTRASRPPVSGNTWRPRKKMLTDNDNNGDFGDTWNEDPYSNSYGSDNDDSYSDGQTATLPGRVGRPARRSNTAIPWASVISIVLVVVGLTSFMLAVVFLAGPVMESLESLGGSSLADDIALLPVETAGVVHIQIEDLLKHQSDYEFLRNNALTQLHSSFKDSNDAEFSRSVRSFTIAIPDDSAKQPGIFAGGSAASSVNSSFMVVRLNKAVSESELERQSGAKSELLEGKNVFRSRGSVLCQFDSRTLLTGKESDILNVLKGNRNTGLASEFRVPSDSGQLCFVMKTSQFAKFAPAMPEPPQDAPDAIRNLAGLVKSIVSIEQVSGVIGLDADGMNIHLDMQLESPGRALTLKEQLLILLKDGFDSFPASPGAPAAISAFSSLQAVLKPTQVTADGDHVVTKVRLSKEQLNQFAGRMPF